MICLSYKPLDRITSVKSGEIIREINKAKEKKKKKVTAHAISRVHQTKLIGHAHVQYAKYHIS